MEAIALEQTAAVFLQMGFSFWVAWYSLTKLKPTIENNTKALAILATKIGVKDEIENEFK
jgi:hypothetical protein